MRTLLAVPLVLAACMPSQVQITSIGPLRVLDDPDVTILNPGASPQAAAFDAAPVQGGLVVRTVNGRAVPFEARAAALQALEAYCLEQGLRQVPLFFGWRETGDEGIWSAAGCEVPGHSAAPARGAD
ncbi:hypothetical protein [Gymnodinialimonas ceratoperidinii]|uniref:Uncharacterized protein n=1 Tax=Gymnodinialimonas ceratoperidinii TaxID=2856823 RepID=A0A8F6TV00_9RHOB|nr:hypothetical protein [Gymnodinialimonas ceratoperidinii]QXT39180.1 hypothetical protein KYE46_14800 [Gymnodinialimonas ceratoperidinii]